MWQLEAAILLSISNEEEAFPLSFSVIYATNTIYQMMPKVFIECQDRNA